MKDVSTWLALAVLAALFAPVAMGRIPAYRQPFRAFRLTDRGLLAD